jgi:hypothetical protein
VTTGRMVCPAAAGSGRMACWSLSVATGTMALWVILGVACRKTAWWRSTAAAVMGTTEWWGVREAARRRTGCWIPEKAAAMGTTEWLGILEAAARGRTGWWRWTAETGRTEWWSPDEAATGTTE